MECFRSVAAVLNRRDRNSAAMPALLAALDSNLFLPTKFLIFAAGFFLIGFGSAIINEFFDANNTDRFVHREKVLVKTPIPSSKILFLWAGLSLAGFLILVRLSLGLFAAAFFFLTNFYSWPPFRFRTRAFWDLFSPIVGYVFVPYLAYFNFVGQEMVSGELIITLLMFSLGFAAVLLASQLEDYLADKKAGLKTTAVTLGPEKSIFLGLVFSLGAMLFLSYLSLFLKKYWYLIFMVPALYLATGFHYSLSKLNKPRRFFEIFAMGRRFGIFLANATWVWLFLILVLGHLFS